MKVLKVKHNKKKTWHSVAGGLYDYQTEEDETTFICELDEVEYQYVANMKLVKSPFEFKKIVKEEVLEDGTIMATLEKGE